MTTIVQNEKFAAIAKTVKGLISKGESVFGQLAAFIHELSSQGHEKAKAEVLAQEKLADAMLKISMGKNSTYKVAKSVLLTCVEKGISIVDADGKVRGKTELEQEIKAAKEEKSTGEKFKITMNTATNIAAKLDASEVLVSLALVNDLRAKLVGMMPASGE